MIALAYGLTATLSAQNLFLLNYTDCKFNVVVRYADVNCDYSQYPEYSPSVVCNPNVGSITYLSNQQSQTTQTTPNGSQICTVHVYDENNNLLITCSCGQLSCHYDDFDCLGTNIDIDITIAQYTTTIKWLP